MTYLHFILTVIAILSLSLHQPAKASDLDDVYYSAAMCKPARSTTSNGQTDLRFEYADAINSDSGPLKGGWYNFDKSNKETLICPVPFNRFISGSVKARVVVNDRSNSTTGTVGVQLCAQSAHGETVCPSGSANSSTGNSFIGTKTVAVEISTAATGSSLADFYRWYWLKLTLPNIDSQTGASGVLGYRVTR